MNLFRALCITSVFAIVSAPFLVWGDELPKEEKSQFPDVRQQGGDVLCGPRSLLAICRFYGLESSLDGIRELSGQNERGTSLYGLKQAALALGFVADGRKLTLGELKSLKAPCIVFVDNNHYFVVEQLFGDQFRIIDGEKDVSLMPVSEFTQRWGGYTLVIQRPLNVTSPEESPRLTVESYLHDLGIIPQGQVVNHQFVVRNIGKVPLKMTHIDKPCCGTNATINPILPRQSGEVQMEISTIERNGRVTESIFAYWNDPQQPLTILTLTGIIDRGIVPMPGEIYLELKPGESVRRKIKFIPPPTGVVSEDYQLEVFNVETSSSHLEAHIYPLIQEEEEGRIVGITVHPTLPTGRIDEWIRVYTNHPRQPMLEIPVRGEVAGPIQVVPQSFFLGVLRPQSQLNQSVKVSGDRPFQIIRVENGLNPFITFEVTPVNEGSGYRIQPQLKSLPPEGKLSGRLVLHTNLDIQKEIVIPVYGLVKK